MGKRGRKPGLLNVIVNCAICNTPISRTPSRVRGRQSVCSAKACRATHFKGIPRPSISAQSIEITQLRQEQPSLSLSAIGERYGITSERVRQILKKAGVPTVTVRPLAHPVCFYCDGVFEMRLSLYNRRVKQGTNVFCAECQKHGKKVKRITFQCEICNKDVALRPRQIAKRIGAKSHHVFCSNQCKGKWLGRNHGIQTRPDDRLKGWETRRAKATLAATEDRLTLLRIRSTMNLL